MSASEQILAFGKTRARLIWDKIDHHLESDPDTSSILVSRIRVSMFVFAVIESRNIVLDSGSLIDYQLGG